MDEAATKEELRPVKKQLVSHPPTTSYIRLNSVHRNN